MKFRPVLTIALLAFVFGALGSATAVAAPNLTESAAIKTERLKELSGEARDDVTYWHFHYTAFLTKTGATQLKMEFYTSDKKFVANMGLDGVDPKTPVLSGEISINEDDGLSKGKPYIIKLVTDRDVVVASTPLVMK